jgi:tRNA (guanine37-N1)-methyltransferase
MRIDVITLFPDALMQSLDFGVIGRARKASLVQLFCTNPRDFTSDNYRRVDERVYGGGPGMVLMLEPLKKALAHIQAAPPEPEAAQPEPKAAQPEHAKLCLSYLSPQGKTFDQAMARQLAARSRIVLLCGRYEGVDQRFVDTYVDEEISIGDFVLSGGELAAMVLIDAVVRLIPGALHTSESAEQDSFEQGLLDCPHYTRPESAEEGVVPMVLKSGDHAAIARWRRMQALGRTAARRPDLLAKLTLSKADVALLAEYAANAKALLKN